MVPSYFAPPKLHHCNRILTHYVQLLALLVYTIIITEFEIPFHLLFSLLKVIDVLNPLYLKGLNALLEQANNEKLIKMGYPIIFSGLSCSAPSSASCRTSSSNPALVNSEFRILVQCNYMYIWYYGILSK